MKHRALALVVLLAATGCYRHATTHAASRPASHHHKTVVAKRAVHVTKTKSRPVSAKPAPQSQSQQQQQQQEGVWAGELD